MRYDMENMFLYMLVGPRLEYELSQETASPVITSSFRKIHVTGSVGAGVELVSYGDIKFFTEVHFNPDGMNSYKHGNLSIRTTAYEIRLGLKYVFSDKHSTCPTFYK